MRSALEKFRPFDQELPPVQQLGVDGFELVAPFQEFGFVVGRRRQGEDGGIVHLLRFDATVGSDRSFRRRLKHFVVHIAPRRRAAQEDAEGNQREL